MNLLDWRRLARAAIADLHAAQKDVRTTRLDIDSDYPTWRIPRDRWPKDFLKHDARRECFVTIGVVLRDVRLNAFFMRDQLTTQKWWQKKGVKGTTATDWAGVVHEYAVMTTLMGVLGLAIAVEETCRAIARPQNSPFYSLRNKDFYNIYKPMLEQLGLRRHKKLFDVVRLIRNTIHTNGVYANKNWPRVRRKVDARVFRFRHGQSLSWVDVALVGWLAEKLASALNDIVRSPRVANITYCPRQP